MRNSAPHLPRWTGFFPGVPPPPNTVHITSAASHLTRPPSHCTPAQPQPTIACGATCDVQWNAPGNLVTSPEVATVGTARLLTDAGFAGTHFHLWVHRDPVQRYISSFKSKIRCCRNEAHDSSSRTPCYVGLSLGIVLAIISMWGHARFRGLDGHGARICILFYSFIWVCGCVGEGGKHIRSGSCRPALAPGSMSVVRLASAFARFPRRAPRGVRATGPGWRARRGAGWGAVPTLAQVYSNN